MSNRFRKPMLYPLSYGSGISARSSVKSSARRSSPAYAPSNPQLVTLISITDDEPPMSLSPVLILGDSPACYESNRVSVSARLTLTSRQRQSRLSRGDDPSHPSRPAAEMPKVALPGDDGRRGLM